MCWRYSFHDYCYNIFPLEEDILANFGGLGRNNLQEILQILPDINDDTVDDEINLMYSPYYSYDSLVDTLSNKRSDFVYYH